MLKNLSSYFSLKTTKINYFFIETLYYLKFFFQKNLFENFVFFAYKMKKKLFGILKYFKKNFFTLFFTLIFVILISLFVNELIKIYCSFFYNFGEFAKIRIVENPAFAFILTPILFWVSGLICKKISFNVAGNGLDNITLAIKKLKVVPFSYKFVANYIGFKTILVIIFSSLISTYGGGSLGREAPSIFISVSIIFSFAYFLRKFLVKIALENWIYLGYALGIFIAFNAPIAGMIYVVEKLIINKAKYYKTSFFIAFTSIMGLYFSVYEYHSVYHIEGFTNLSLNHLLHYLAIACICALFANLFLKITKYFYCRIMILEGFKWHLFPIIFGLLVAFIGNYFGIYSIGGGIRSVNDSLMSQNIIHGFNELIGRYISTILTYLSGNSGGFVAPAIALGNVVGSTYASLFEHINPKTLMIVGMVAFLSPILNIPIASAMIIVESVSLPKENFFILVIISYFAYYNISIFQLFIKKLSNLNFFNIKNS